ncbi:response regulator [Ruminococcus sp. AF17-22AC]|uniref:response regulator transcription factor n=1 Tax=Ruminococcus sp. AF17-22AC TaxID=2292248 RepID=UPI0015F30DE1|nr:response regulator [Ruminococcus sp. AF17-22AC]
MIKVLIADDELRICELIFRLIDWESLGMSVIAVAHDGRETIKIIKNEMPDIVITDIRMPGYNGVDVIRIGKEYNSDIQFIIISGYSQFDYAQNAIHYGVSDYLLKPVKAEELTKALLRIKSRIDKNNQMYSQVKKAWTLEQQNRRLYREQLIMEIAHGKGFDVLTKDMNTLNEQYKYEFIPGFFTIVIVKADGLNFEEKTESSFLYEKIQQSLSFAFAPVMQEMQGTMLDNGTYIFLFNYENEYAEIESQIHRLLNQMLLQKDVFKKLHLTIGLGKRVNCLVEVGKSYETAYLAIKDRILVGTDRIIEGKEKIVVQDYKDYFLHTVRELENVVENLDDKRISDIIQEWGTALSKDKEINGYQIEQSAKALVNSYLLSMQKNNYTLDEDDNLLKDFMKSIENCISLGEIQELLSGTLEQSLSEYRHKRALSGSKPIRDAKEYIRNNLAGNLTIQEVSEYVGYSSAHFSVRFKQECGITFSDYVMESRIEKSKELLKNTRETIESIAAAVGYSDVKSFTKNFKKYTEVKPSQYRKIYG